MRKVIVVLAALLAALFVAGCTSAPSAASAPSASDKLAEVKASAPAGTLVAQATGTAGKDKDAAQKKAEQNAALQLVRALGYVAGEMIDEQAAAGRLSAGVASEFKQKVNTALTKVSIAEAVKVESGVAAGDVGYAVYYLDKGEAQKVLTKAVNAAKEEVAAGNFNFGNYDAKFAAAAGKEWKN